MGILERIGLTALIVSLGCALRVQPVPIAAHLDGASDAANGALRLGVGHFADARPAAERERRRPPLRLSWRGLVREGENALGDESFTDAVADGVRRDVIATLARSGDFARVRPLDFDGGGWPEAAGVDYALVGRIEEFGARQYQRSEFSPFWAGWVRSRYDAPEGRVRVHYRLYAPEGLVWQARLETSESREGIAITQAALEAMAQNSEQLAARLRGAVATASEGPHLVRALGVRVLDGCRLGPVGVSRALADVVGAFEREAGVRLELQPEPWLSPPGADLAGAFGEVARLEPPPGGVLVALMPLEGERAAWRPDVRYGMAHPFGSHAVVGCSPSGEVRGVTVLHELGHLFGAVHVVDPSSPMHPVSEFDARFFDPLNRRILRTARERPFGAPLPEELVQRLDAIYRAAARFPERVEPADLETARAALRDHPTRSSVGASGATQAP